MNFENYLQEKGFIRRTISEYKRIIEPLQNWSLDQNIELEAMSYTELMGYLQELKSKHLSIGTLIQHQSDWKRYFDYLIAVNKLTDNPANQIKLKGVKKKIIRKYVKENELIRHYEQFKNKPHEDTQIHSRNLVLLGLFIWQGITLSELKRLLVSDVYLEEGKVLIVASKQHAERYLELDSRQIIPLMKYLEHQRGESLFSGDVRSLVSVMLKRFNKISEQSTTATEFRTSRIIAWLNQYNVREVQYRAGFKYLSSLERYRNQNVDGLRKVVDQVFPL